MIEDSLTSDSHSTSTFFSLIYGTIFIQITQDFMSAYEKARGEEAWEDRF